MTRLIVLVVAFGPHQRSYQVSLLLSGRVITSLGTKNRTGSRLIGYRGVSTHNYLQQQKKSPIRGLTDAEVGSILRFAKRA